MKFCLEMSSDIKKYFQGSFVKFPMAGEVVHYVDRVDGHQIRGKMFAPTETGGFEEQPFVFHLNPEDSDTPDVEFILPRKSYFNHQNSAHILFRVPARQYHRGVTNENTCIACLDSDGDFPVQNLSFERITAYVGKQAFCDFRERPDWRSYAVSRRCAVSKSRAVFMDRVRIGTISYNGQGCIMLSSDVFLPEVTKLVAEHGQNLIVKVAEKQAAVKRATAKKSTTGLYVPSSGMVMDEFVEIENNL